MTEKESSNQPWSARGKALWCYFQKTPASYLLFPQPRHATWIRSGWDLDFRSVKNKKLFSSSSFMYLVFFHTATTILSRLHIKSQLLKKTKTNETYQQTPTSTPPGHLHKFRRNKMWLLWVPKVWWKPKTWFFFVLFCCLKAFRPITWLWGAPTHEEFAGLVLIFQVRSSHAPFSFWNMGICIATKIFT